MRRHISFFRFGPAVADLTPTANKEDTMGNKLLTLFAILACIRLLSSSCAQAQDGGANSQCKLLSGTNFGKVVPYHGDPAPPLNSACKVGNDSGYVVRTSSRIGINVNSRCTITVSGKKLEVPYETDASPALNSPCTVGYVQGYISSTTANVRVYPSVNRLTSIELLEALEKPGAMTELMLHAPLPPIIPAGLKVTEDSEGWVPHLYNDAARYCTIGYGHLIKKAPCNGTEPYQHGLTLPEGVKLLQGDLYSAHRTVTTAVTITLTDAQTAALTDFVFNVGSANFRNSTLLKVVNARQYNQAVQ
jgi:GH24 family phage-related lysozyme (muramidase)